MNKYFCNICCRSIKNNSKKKHENSKKHIFLSNHIINRYQINNPKHGEIEDILQKYIDKHRRRFYLFCVICKFKMISKNITLEEFFIVLDRSLD